MSRRENMLHKKMLKYICIHESIFSLEVNLIHEIEIEEKQQQERKKKPHRNDTSKQRCNVWIREKHS